MKNKCLMRVSVCAMCAAVLLSTTVSASIGRTDYVVDDRGKVSLPSCYIPEKRIERVYEGSYLNAPRNIFIDDSDNLYVADSGNNRIAVFDSEMNFTSEFSAGGTLSEPSGAYYDSENSLLYVADTANERVVVLDKDDKVVKEFKKPESDLLDENLRFNPSNIALGRQGYLYVLKGQYFMQVSQNGEFKGFVGSTKVGASFISMLIRRFASKKQKEQLVSEQPRSYLNFTMSNDGIIYAVASTNTAQIRKINMVGDNLYPEKFYGERVQDVSGKYVNPNFISIAVSNDGIISVLEENSKKIYQYSQEGVMLNVFGGEGEVSGFFTTPVSIATDSAGSIYVADSSQNSVLRVTRTAFSSAVYRAQTAYDKGDYEEAYKLYSDAGRLDPNYSVLNNGIAKCLYKMDRTEEAAAAYKSAGNREGVGDMNTELRSVFMKKYFGPICLAAALVIAAIIITVKKLKKYTDKLVRKYYRLDE